MQIGGQRAATVGVTAGKLSVPSKRVLMTKMSRGRIRLARPPPGFVHVLTLPWVLIRINIVNRVRAGPVGLRPSGGAGQPHLGLGRRRRGRASADQEQGKHGGGDRERDQRAGAKGRAPRRVCGDSCHLDEAPRKLAALLTEHAKELAVVVRIGG